MLLLRIGGDEFALITGLYDEDKAKALGEEVLRYNGSAIQYEDQEIPISLWCAVTSIPESLRYNEFFANIHVAIRASKG